MFGSASQGDDQADQLYFGMLGSLIAFLWSAAEHLLLIRQIMRLLTNNSKYYSIKAETEIKYFFWGV